MPPICCPPSPLKPEVAKDSRKPLSARPTPRNLGHRFSINGDRYRYNSGRLSRLDNPRPSTAPGFLKSTKTSEARRKETLSFLTDAQQRIRAFTHEKRALATSRQTPEPATSDLTSEHDWPSVPSTPIPEQHPITPATPIPYRIWIRSKSALANCFQNHSLAMEFTSTAFALAKEALWHWARDHNPALFERLSPYGANMIQADFGELRHTTREWQLAPELRYRLENLARLRNFVAHPNPMFNLTVYNKFARFGEELIRELGDEGRLARLREAQAGLSGDAERTLAEVEARESLAELQGANFMGSGAVWKLSHEDLFKRVLFHSEERRHDPKEFPALVARAAERWGEVNGLGNVQFLYCNHTRELTGIMI